MFIFRIALLFNWNLNIMESMATRKIAFLTEEQIKPLLSWSPLVEVIEKAMGAVSKSDGGIQQPPRLFLNIPNRKALLLSMPGYSEENNALAVKLVTAFPKNPENNLPTIMGNIFLFNSETGQLEVIMEATEITAWRTAAASVVATKYMAQRKKIITILGAGVQGAIHIRAMWENFKPQEIRVWNRKISKAQQVVDQLNLPSVHVEENIEKALKGADIICTTTSASEPILFGKYLSPGAHINAIGAGLTHYAELDKEAYDKGIIFVDSLPSAQKELAGLLDLGYEIKGEVGELVNNTKIINSMRNESNVTIFHSLGMAVEDVVSAKLVYERYKRCC